MIISFHNAYSTHRNEYAVRTENSKVFTLFQQHLSIKIGPNNYPSSQRRICYSSFVSGSPLWSTKEGEPGYVPGRDGSQLSSVYPSISILAKPDDILRQRHLHIFPIDAHYKCPPPPKKKKKTNKTLSLRFINLKGPRHI